LHFFIKKKPFLELTLDVLLVAIVKKFIKNKKNIACVIINDHMAPLLIFFPVYSNARASFRVEDEELNFDTM
jgi:hypothetical protein